LVNQLKSIFKLAQHIFIDSRDKLFLLFLVCSLVAISIFPLGLDSVYLGATLRNSPEELAESFGLSDAGSYLKAALELHSLGGLTSDKHWVINLWPPGMVLLNAALISIFGTNFAIAYAVLIAILWSTFFYFLGIKILERWGVVPSVISLALLISSGPFQNWIFDNGLFYAEGVSQLFFLTGLIALVKASRSDEGFENFAYGILAGTSLAIAAYFRATFSTLESVLLLSLIFASITWALGSRIQKLSGLQESIRRFTISVGGAWVSMFLLMEPWLQYTTLGIRGIRTWSVVSGSFFRGVWVERSEQAAFLAQGGVGWGCELDPAFCNKVEAYEQSTGSLYPVQELAIQAVRTAVFNFPEYLSDRFNFISVGWFSNEASIGAPNILSGFVALVGLVAFLVFAVNRIWGGELIYLVILSMAALLLLPQMIGHIEPRYFIPLKLFVVVLAWASPSSKRKNLGAEIIALQNKQS
jgi:hypothetical protein